MMAELPRVLFITNEPPQPTGAGSIVFHRLFHTYPADRLGVVTNAPLGPSGQRLGCRYWELALRADRLKRTRFWKWRATLRALGAESGAALNAIERITTGFKPELVATLMQDGWYYDVAANYARRHRLPLVLFIHDLPDGFEPVPRWLESRQGNRDRRVYSQAAVRLCISPGMEADFASRFGVRGEVLPPPGSPTPVRQAPEVCATLKRPDRLSLGYAGGLHYGYGEQLLAMLPVLGRTGTFLELFGTEPDGCVRPLRDAADVVHINGRQANPEAAWRGLLERCDAVLQPYLNPPGAHERQYRTHFPSKLGDCLSLGLPLLITGPGYASGTRWCLDHPGCAVAVTSPNPADLEQALVRLRNEPSLRIEVASTAASVAAAFDVQALRSQLHAALRRAASVSIPR